MITNIYPNYTHEWSEEQEKDIVDMEIIRINEMIKATMEFLREEIKKPCPVCKTYTKITHYQAIQTMDGCAKTDKSCPAYKRCMEYIGQTYMIAKELRIYLTFLYHLRQQARGEIMDD